ncbi:hypothetical protein C8R44DRAFT_875927 [Mycena epipterygia]|nr:hypothetical protein C8R44DRAFT_875927 [Mycena epipterygia]
MNKSQFYLSQCVDAASKSTMYYKLGSALVKGGKGVGRLRVVPTPDLFHLLLSSVISTGFNHQRPNYEKPGNGTPVSKFNRATAQRHPKQQHGNEVARQKQQNRNVRRAEAQDRDLERRRAPKLVSYEGKPRRTFYPPRYYNHDQLHEADAASEHGHGVCPGARASARKQGRSRYSRLNGADLYVCRINKDGFGCSKPCWRCVDWCAWAGVAAAGDLYQTSVDTRLHAARALQREGRPSKTAPHMFVN